MSLTSTSLVLQSISNEVSPSLFVERGKIGFKSEVKVLSQSLTEDFIPDGFDEFNEDCNCFALEFEWFCIGLATLDRLFKVLLSKLGKRQG